MKQTALELAKKYYPRLWSAERIENLVSAGKLTREEADEAMSGREGEESEEEDEGEG